MDGHSGVEASDLRGYLIGYANDDGDEKLVWQDGPLSQAFRQAQNGEKTVLFIDEIGRIPSNEQNILVAALTKDHDENYSFNTGRVVNVENGVAQTEIITVPSNMLWVVGTTNVGSDYNVDEFETALQDRFRFVRLDTDKGNIKQALTKVCKARKFKVGVANKLVRLYQDLMKLKTNAMISNEVNLRHLVEIVLFAVDESDIVDEIKRTMNLWVGRHINDGKLLEDQVENVQMVIDEIFKA